MMKVALAFRQFLRKRLIKTVRGISNGSSQNAFGLMELFLGRHDTHAALSCTNNYSATCADKGHTVSSSEHTTTQRPGSPFPITSLTGITTYLVALLQQNANILRCHNAHIRGIYTTNITNYTMAPDRSTMDTREDNARSLVCYLYPAQCFERQQAQNGCH